MLRRFIRHAFVPMAVVVALVAFAWRDAIGRAAGMDGSTTIFLSLLGLITLAEHLAPAREDWRYRLLSGSPEGWNQLGRDLFYLLFVTLISAALVGAVAARVEPVVRQLSRPWWPVDAPAPARLALAFLVVELANYALHFAAHKVGVLWRFHRTHHAVTTLGGLKALRTHPVENVLFHLARAVPLLMLGATSDDVVAATFLGGVLGLLSHANLDAEPGVLGLVLNYPRYHAVHHSADLAQSLHNFGCHTVLFDRLFGTFDDGAVGPVQVGLSPPGWRSAWDELVAPLYRWRP